MSFTLYVMLLLGNVLVSTHLNLFQMAGVLSKSYGPNDVVDHAYFKGLARQSTQCST